MEATIRKSSERIYMFHDITRIELHLSSANEIDALELSKANSRIPLNFVVNPNTYLEFRDLPLGERFGYLFSDKSLPKEIKEVRVQASTELFEKIHLERYLVSFLNFTHAKVNYWNVKAKDQYIEQTNFQAEFSDVNPLELTGAIFAALLDNKSCLNEPIENFQIDFLEQNGDIKKSIEKYRMNILS